MNVVYDAGALIAAERNSRQFVAIHRGAIARGVERLVPAAVLAQVWAGGGPRQALLARTLLACRVEPLDEAVARRIGGLRIPSGSSDVVDISVVELALRFRPAMIVTSDSGDIESILDALGLKLPIERV